MSPLLCRNWAWFSCCAGSTTSVPCGRRPPFTPWRAIFGADLIDAQIARIDAVLAHEEYATGHVSLKQRHQAISLLLLLNRSPWVEHLSWALLDRAEALAFPRAASVIRGNLATLLGYSAVLLLLASRTLREVE